MDITSEAVGLASSESESTTGFLDLPLELREQVYYICLDKTQRDEKFKHSLTLVCWQMRLETMPILFREDITFLCLAKFSDWVARGPPGLLKCVDSILLRVQRESSIDPKQMDLTNYNPFHYISQLRNLLLEVDLFPEGTRKSPTETITQTNFLVQISSSCPDLRSLELSCGPTHLSFLTPLQNLRHLCWTGYSLSTPKEALSILNALPSLRSLTILSDDANIFKYGMHLNFTDYLLANLNPLARLEILDLRHLCPCKNMESPKQLVFMTHDLVRGLVSHRRRLRDLVMRDFLVIDSDLLDDLLRVLSSFNLVQLRLNFWLTRGSRIPDVKLYIGQSISSCDIELYHVDKDGGLVLYRYTLSQGSSALATHVRKLDVCYFGP